MSEFLDVIDAFGTPLKLAWVGWLAWGVGQYFWFRHERAAGSIRKTAPAAQIQAPAPAPAPAAKKAAVPKPVAVQAAEAPVVGRLITPTHVAADTKAAPPPAEVAAPGAPVAAAADEPTAAFDPSKAVIEQFGVHDSALDKFVRDFEMQDARPRRRRNLPPDGPAFGDGAPQTP